MAFFDVLWPWFERYFEALEAVTDEHRSHLEFPLSVGTDFRFEEESDINLPPDTILAGLQTAAECLAQSDPDTWLDWADKLGTQEIAPAQRLIAHSFTVEPERYADAALRFLLEDSRRYHLGSISDRTGTSSRLVKVASGYWSKMEIRQFYAAVNDFKLPYPGRLFCSRVTS